MNHDWEEFRREMPVAQKWAYFDHAAVAPLSQPARNAIERWLAQATEEGDTVWPEWSKQVERTRRNFALALGARPEEIAFIPNTTTGIGLVAEGFRWNAGDNIVTLENEFPSNMYPWLNLQRRDVETRMAPVEPDGRVDMKKLLATCDEHTRIIAISWVGYASGWRVNLNEIVDLAHRRGILVFVDAIQGLGVFPLDVAKTKVDFLAADGHKWLLGPEGAGVLYIRREHLERLDPLMIGWNSVMQQQDFSRIELTLRGEAARYEGGSQNMAGVAALGASAEMLIRYGWGKSISAIGQRVMLVTDSACLQLEHLGAKIITNRDGDHRSGIVLFELPGKDPQAVRRHCLQNNVALSCRAGRLRIAAHAYNDLQDLDRLIEALRSA
ncbi:MAG: aminotransferase class V-fold PLP-dependent enzyme [Planctomycetales bacterium]|nr:aminotransferase class V-fold PLP-dependent enzyme [Planctomycetales bacterium]